MPSSDKATLCASPLTGVGEILPQIHSKGSPERLPELGHTSLALVLKLLLRTEKKELNTFASYVIGLLGHSHTFINPGYPHTQLELLEKEAVECI